MALKKENDSGSRLEIPVVRDVNKQIRLAGISAIIGRQSRSETKRDLKNKMKDSPSHHRTVCLTAEEFRECLQSTFGRWSCCVFHKTYTVMSSNAGLG